LREARGDEPELGYEPVDRREPGRGQESREREHREGEQDEHRARETELRARDGQGLHPLGGCVGAQERPEVPEQREDDERSADGEREDSVRERRQHVARESAQDRGGAAVDDQGSRGPRAGSPLRREAGPEDAVHATPHGDDDTEPGTFSRGAA
jgi:hypothetical protein